MDIFKDLKLTPEQVKALGSIQKTITEQEIAALQKREVKVIENAADLKTFINDWLRGDQDDIGEQQIQISLATLYSFIKVI